MARIEPLGRDEWPKEMGAAMAALVGPAGRHPRPRQEDRPAAENTLGTFAHHPVLARAWMTFNGHVLFGTTLSERQREILILRVAAMRKSGYEWIQHLYMGRDAGLDDEDIGRIAFGPEAPFWTELEAALLRSVDELIGDGRLSEATWTALAKELDTQQILDVIFTVGAYEILAWMFRSFELGIDKNTIELHARSKRRRARDPAGTAT